MFALKRNIIIDFDSERISVMEKGVLLKSSPATVVRKKSEAPVAIAYGEEAEIRKHNLNSSEFYCHPFRNGKIIDEKSARLLFCCILRELFGKNKLLHIYVLVSGGLEDDDQRKIEQSFSAAGYGKVTLLPRPIILAQLLAYNNMYAATYMDADLTEFVLASNGEILSAHTIGVSVTALAEELREKFLTDKKLKVSVDTSVSIAKYDCSLFATDATQICAHGTDAVTSAKKSIYVSARELYKETENVYRKVTELIEAVLLDENKDFALEIANSGIIFLGSGTEMNGFEEFAFKRLGVCCVISRNNFLLLEVACSHADKLSENV